MAAIAWSETQPGRLQSAARRQALILCVEVRNFALDSDVLEPGLVLQQVDRFFQLVSDSVGEQGGELLCINNDGAVCSFRGGPPTQFAQRALRAAQRVQREFANLENEWSSSFGVRGAVAMGLHLGEAVFGEVASVGRSMPVAFGDCVAIASRLMRRARAGEFILSDAVMGALSVSNLDLDAERLPALDVGRNPAMGIYGVLLDTRLDFT